MQTRKQRLQNRLDDRRGRALQQVTERAVHVVSAFAVAVDPGRAARHSEGAACEIAEHIPQPGDAVRHPARCAAAQPLCAEEALAGGKAMVRLAVNVALVGDVVPGQRLQPGQRVGHRHCGVVAPGKHKAGAGVFVHAQGGVRRTGQVGFHRGLVNDRIAQNGRVGALASHGRGAGGQVPARRKADDRQLVRVEGPVPGMAADQRGGGLVILKRVRPGGLYTGGVAQHKSLEPGLQVGKRHRVGFTVRAHLVAAARQHEHGRAAGQWGKFAAYRLQIGRQHRAMAGWELLFENLHIGSSVSFTVSQNRRQPGCRRFCGKDLGTGLFGMVYAWASPSALAAVLAAASARRASTTLLISGIRLSRS